MITLPTTHELVETDTLESLAFEYYGAYEGWSAIAEANGFRSWGFSTPIMLSTRYSKGGKLKIPQWSPTVAKQLSQPTTAGTVAII
jgi:nucleoid-associated protein YgaU